jgi:NDP-sugar pyrophosphorylase family protein
MRAMVLAAGLGTRLRPLTDDRPKALVTVAGRTMLDLTLARLCGAGIRDVVINVHHYADKVIEYLTANGNFNMHIEISREDILLDTGGGLKKAGWFFLKDGAAHEPFLVHNVDVISTIDLARVAEFHQQHNALATLAVQNRRTSRPLLFGPDGELCGRRHEADRNVEMVRDVSDPQALAFAGIHVISPALLSKLSEEGSFSIIPAYLRLAAAGEKILGFRADDYYWRDLGKPESIAQATRDIESGTVPSI